MGRWWAANLRGGEGRGQVAGVDESNFPSRPRTQQVPNNCQTTRGVHGTRPPPEPGFANTLSDRQRESRENITNILHILQRIYDPLPHKRRLALHTRPTARHKRIPTSSDTRPASHPYPITMSMATDCCPIPRGESGSPDLMRPQFFCTQSAIVSCCCI